MTREQTEKRLREKYGARYEGRMETTSKFLHKKLEHLSEAERQLIFDVADDVGLANDFDFNERLGDMAEADAQTMAISPDPPPFQSPPPIEAPKPEPKPLSADAAARLRQIESPSSEEFKRWQGGDKEINAERESLYESQFPGPKIEIV